MNDFSFNKVTAVMLHNGKWIEVEPGSFESSMLEIAGKQLPVFVFRSKNDYMYCAPLGSLHAMRCMPT